MNKDLIKVYCGQPLDNIAYLEILNPNFGLKKRKNIFGDGDIFDDFIEPIVEVVYSPRDADFLLIPHSYFVTKNKKDYIDKFIKLSKDFNKKIIVFAIGDSPEYIDIDNSLVIRTSQYKNLKRDNEIIVPAYASDLSYGLPIEYKPKGSIATVGFCGWATVDGFWKNVLFNLKNTLFLRGPYKKGLYFRKYTLRMIARSPLINANIIVRKSYGANSRTIELDPKLARREYRDNIINSDFTVCPKGDGNFSVRFYEVLSLGRVPILIDTDCILPLEDSIDYSKFILRIDYRNIKNIDSIVSDFYSKISEKQWVEMQAKAKEMFDKYLRADVFFRNLFKRENLYKYISS